MDDQEAYRKARKRAAAKMGVHIHAAAYIVVNVLLVAINLITSREYPWCIWPIMGWGIGLFFHALIVYAFAEGSGIKERMVEKELKRISSRGH